MYLSWLDQVTYNEVTKPRYGSVYPWPLNHILTWQKKQQIYKKLAALGWTSKTLEEVLKVLTHFFYLKTAQNKV